MISRRLGHQAAHTRRWRICRLLPRAPESAMMHTWLKLRPTGPDPSSREHASAIFSVTSDHTAMTRL
jgi:hypothetical protein